jgi:hypothetical protein
MIPLQCVTEHAMVPESYRRLTSTPPQWHGSRWECQFAGERSCAGGADPGAKKLTVKEVLV